MGCASELMHTQLIVENKRLSLIFSVAKVLQE